MLTDLSIGMAGSGGDGIVSAGDSLMTALAIEGYFAMLTKSFGPQIRGGESSFRLRVATTPVRCPGGALDVAVALNWDDFLKFGAELPVTDRTVVLYEAASKVAPDALPLKGVTPRAAVAVPIEQMAREIAGTEKGKNTIVLGLVAGYFGLAQAAILAGLKKRFGKKGEDVLVRNERAFQAGVEYAQAHPIPSLEPMAPPAARTPRLLTDGNDMTGAAAIFAGCTFFGGYPITPSTEIMQYLTREIWKYGGTVLQCEDEIAGIGACVGASFAGKKVMTATSGPGMSLKTEILGLASIAELPLVAVNVQRGGPSTGIPTKSEQSDLFQAAFSAHGDVVRPVLAPTSVADTFGTVVEAFNMAEQYQTPVIVLSDQEIGQRKEAFERIDTSKFQLVDRLRPGDADLEPYIRFRDTETGVSPLSHPGMERGNYLASGIEHNEHGAPTANGAVHARMNEKRLRKLDPLALRRDLFETYGPADAPIALVAWGSLAGVVVEARDMADAEGLAVKVLVPKLLYPVAEEVYREFFASVRAGLVVEQSHQGQLYRVLRMFVDVPRGLKPFARSGSNPFSPDEVLARVREIAGQFRADREPVGQAG
ncbi:MAG: 2-oxoacid:acceptor oxidoreductase subunit alpha [Vicinamibacteraceae bacterium]|nr:2-oxoacid:acceptor oxidoreductase subunit alpha [Vicinamibacteraceae bacterium]